MEKDTLFFLTASLIICNKLSRFQFDSDSTIPSSELLSDKQSSPTYSKIDMNKIIAKNIS